MRLLKFTIKALFFTAGIMLGIAWMLPSSKGVSKLPNLPVFGTNPSNPQYSPNIKIFQNDKGICSAVVIDAKYALTAAHCLAGLGLHYNVVDEYGKDTKTVVLGAAINERLDIALLYGDFNNFKFAKLNFTSAPYMEGTGSYQTCGFPYLQKGLTCVPFIPRSNSTFQLTGIGFVIPGMSGGAVYDVTSQSVIGVNSSAGLNFISVTPTLGVLGAFGIEPERK